MGSTRLAIVAAFGLVAFALNAMLSHAPADEAEAAATPTTTAVTVPAAPAPPVAATAPPPTTSTPTTSTTAAPARASRSADPDRVWRALAACESSGDPRAVSPSGRYFGAFQFDLPTWRDLGYTGNPADHSFAVQLEAAKKLHAQRGWRPWPTCSRRLSLR